MFSPSFADGVCKLTFGVGCLTIACIFVKLLRNVYSFLTRVSIPSPESVGKWAVVTGSTDGIGLAYVKNLARRNFNIVLISRSESKLKNVSDELKTLNSNIEVVYVVVDFSNRPFEYVDVLKSALSGLDIGVLVNCVGLGYDHPEFIQHLFEDIKDGVNFSEKMIAVNVSSLNTMIALVLPEMIKKNCGLIISISSMSAQIDSPLLSVYAASKAYVTKFSECLRLELAFGNQGNNVVVQTLTPGLVPTKLSKVKKDGLGSPNPDKFVASAISKLTASGGGAKSCLLSAGYWVHDVQIFALNTLPEFVWKMFMFDGCMSMRRKALSKKDK